MNTLRDIVDSETSNPGAPQSLGPSCWNWNDVKRVLFIRLRSIGDTVLATPSIDALKRFAPNAELDILVEDWVAPVLAEHPNIDRIITLERNSLTARARVAHELRSRSSDVVYTPHGGPTATFLTRATGAQHRVGYASYQYSHLHNHQAPSPLLLWGQQKTHSVEQQLALLGWTGVPVTDRPPTHLAVTESAAVAVSQRLQVAGLEGQKLALIHPAAAFATKQWASENFARVVEHLAEHGFASVAIAASNETQVLNDLV